MSVKCPDAHEAPGTRPTQRELLWLQCTRSFSLIHSFIHLQTMSGYVLCAKSMADCTAQIPRGPRPSETVAFVDDPDEEMAV